jgi:hypothetical protein
MAEAQASKAGVETIQAYCEDLLAKAIAGEKARETIEVSEARHGPFEGLHAIANDPEYLAEWTASLTTRDPIQDVEEVTRATPTAAAPSAAESNGGLRPAEEVVLRHAGLRGNDPSAFLPTLRRGEPVPALAAQELLQALIDLEAASGDTISIDRRLAYALHRLAFEGQVLVTDAWPGAAADAGTVDLLRIVQEGVDRVLSGEDIRYYPQES